MWTVQQFDSPSELASIIQRVILVLVALWLTWWLFTSSLFNEGPLQKNIAGIVSQIVLLLATIAVVAFFQWKLANFPGAYSRGTVRQLGWHAPWHPYQFIGGAVLLYLVVVFAGLIAPCLGTGDGDGSFAWVWGVLFSLAWAFIGCIVTADPSQSEPEVLHALSLSLVCCCWPTLTMRSLPLVSLQNGGIAGCQRAESSDVLLGL